MDIPTSSPPASFIADQPNEMNGYRTDFLRTKRNSEQLCMLVIFIDYILLNAIFYFQIRADLYDNFAQQKNFTASIIFLIIVQIVWYLVVKFSNIYQISGGVKLKLKVEDLFKGAFLFFGVISMILHQFFSDIFQVQFLVPSFFIFTGIASLIHLGMRYYNRSHTGSLYYAVVGGNANNISYVEEVFERIYGNNTHCVGRFAKSDLKGTNHLGDYEQIEEFIKNNPINKLLYFSSNLSQQKIQRIIELCRTKFIDFEIVPKEISIFKKGFQVEELLNLPVYRHKKTPLNRMENKMLKRVFDVIFSLFIILLVFPWLLPLCAIAIKLESRGPIFFIQKRTGYWNKPFECFKFRTMTVNKQSDEKQATKNDARITKVGAFLRKTSLDEFPQFINVLKGDMSIVGPRPHMLKHTSDYSKLIDKFMIRHEVKPGITGWAQVNGWRGPTTEVYQMAKRVEYDVDYIENWSFWFDYKCVFLTIFNMVKGEENAL